MIISGQVFLNLIALPCKKDPNIKINIWSMIKDAIGKDLS